MKGGPNFHFFVLILNHCLENGGMVECTETELHPSEEEGAHWLNN